MKIALWILLLCTVENVKTKLALCVQIYMHDQAGLWNHVYVREALADFFSA